MYQQGRSYANARAVLYVLAQPGGCRRAGYTAGRRLGGAVVRNRAKRLLREAHRLTAPHWDASVDMVWVARRGLVGAGLKEATMAVQDLLRRAGLMRTAP